MSLTENYKNAQLKDVALSKYENEQRNQIPAEVVDLPSQGKVYPEDSPFRSGKVELRYMTAREEDILTTKSYIDNGIVFDKLIDSLLVNGNSDDLIYADKEAIIIAIRILNYGKQYPVTVTDPETKGKIETEIDLSKIKDEVFTLQPDENGYFDFKTSSGIDIKFKYLNSREIKKLDQDSLITSLLINSIMSIDGETDKSKIEDFILYKFLSKDSRELRAYMTKHAPGLNMTFEFEGENGGTFTSVFQFTIDFLWI